MTHTLDVVVVAHNSKHVLGDMLDSLPGALQDVPARVVVVDNGSTDGTVAFLKERGNCLVVESSNVGYSAGINRGVAALDGQGPILILNPDLRLAEGAIPPLMQTLELPRTGVAAPRVLNADGSPNLSLRREPTLLRAVGLGFTGLPLFSEHVTEPDAYEVPGNHAWALGAALLIGRQCHNELGGWDESFFLYSEETDFCLRARDKGWVTRYEPRSTVVHIGGESGRSPRIHAMQIVNKVRFYRRRHHIAASLLYLGLTIASEASWVLRGNRQSLTAINALVRASRRPAELGCPHRLPW